MNDQCNCMNDQCNWYEGVPPQAKRSRKRTFDDEEGKVYVQRLANGLKDLQDRLKNVDKRETEELRKHSYGSTEEVKESK